MLISIHHWNLKVCGDRLLSKSPVNFFCSTSLPLASTRWVRLTFSSLCQLFWAVPSINLSNIKRQIFGSACPWSDPATPSPVNITCHLFGLAQVRMLWWAELFNQRQWRHLSLLCTWGLPKESQKQKNLNLWAAKCCCYFFARSKL